MVKTVLLKKCSLRRYLKNCQPVGKFMCVIKIFLCVTKVIPSLSQALASSKNCIRPNGAGRTAVKYWRTFQNR